MEGPTPVSALIHAATMVTAGVYMVARCTPLFVHSPTAQMVVSGIGAVTALLAALIALTQYDLKRVLAYSTVSQLGYMFMALGAAAAGPEAATLAVTAAMFHLFTHAFFKALLFLSAGSVMHSMGDVIDMRQFGGLRRVLPITHWTFLVRRCGTGRRAAALRILEQGRNLCGAVHGVAHGRSTARFTDAILAIAAFTAFAHGVLHVPRILPDVLGRRAISARGRASSARSAAGDGVAAADPGGVRAVHRCGRSGRRRGLATICITRSGSAKAGEEGFVVGAGRAQRGGRRGWHRRWPG